MADIVLLRCENNYARNQCPVLISTSSPGAVQIPLGTELAAALKLLLEAGYTIRSSDGDPSGFSYTLIRDTIPGPPGMFEFFEQRIGQTITIETNGGTVSGVILLVGTDVVQLQEPTGDLLLVLFDQINAAYS